MATTLVFDIGGTLIRAGKYCTETGQLLSTKKVFTPNIWNTFSDGYNSHIDLLLKELKGLTEDLFFNQKPASVTIGFPAPITPSGEVYKSSTIWGDHFQALPISSILRDLWPNSVVTIMNDVTAAGYYFTENCSEDFCIITVSSGIGSKIFINGEPCLGINGRGGEIGHWKTDLTNDLLCECGERGHLGAIASGRGVLALAKILAEKDTEAFAYSQLAKLTNGKIKEITCEFIVEAFRNGDKWSVSLIAISAQHLAKAISAIHTSIGIEKFIIIGGFASALGEEYRNQLIKFSKNSCWFVGQEWNEMIYLLPGGIEAGLLGAGIKSKSLVVN